MASSDTFDVVVIGAGPAGEVAAGRAAGQGLSVAIVEREKVGGECSYWGCIPSKALLRPGDVLAAARRVPGAAEVVGAGHPDPAGAFARRDDLTGHLDDAGQLPWLEQQGVTLVRGTARLAGERTVHVRDGAGNERTVRANRGVIIATGTTALLPPIPGLDRAGAWTNREATQARSVPERLVVLGGGAVGVEMAQAFKRLGSRAVTIVEGGPRLLAKEEPFVGEELATAFGAEGIEVITGHHATRVERNGSVVLTLDDGTSCVGDELMVAVGRRAAVHDLGLESLGVRVDDPLAVDDRLRVQGVEGGWLYAVGDVNGRALLTHMGKYQGRIAADHLAGRDVRDEASTAVVPRVTFTDPQVAAVGYTEAQASAHLARVRTVRYGTFDTAGGATSGVGQRGTSQLVIDDERSVLVGATFTGPGVADLLHAATIAIAGQVPLDRLWHAVPAFPTVSEIWLKLLESAGL